MNRIEDIFLNYPGRPETQDGVFSLDEVRLANRNSGALLETLTRDITPTGIHYLLNHFDVPLIDEADHCLTLSGAFADPTSLSMADIRAMPEVTMPVTLECAGNGRTGVSPRSHSMPWSYEAVGTSEWTGTPLAPLIDQAHPKAETVEIAFTGADFGFDKGVPHFYGRSLTLAQLDALEVLLVHSMNGAPLLPQHGAPLRIIVPGWYGMASVKWLTGIEALTKPYQGFQQVETYRFRTQDGEDGVPITEMRVKSLMAPPGVPDWTSRKRFCQPGPVTITGRAWSGGGVPVARVELSVDGTWQDARLEAPISRYVWAKWTARWDATKGAHVLRCRAHAADGRVQPLDAPFDLSGFANNAAQEVEVFVGDLPDRT